MSNSIPLKKAITAYFTLSDYIKSEGLSPHEIKLSDVNVILNDGTKEYERRKPLYDSLNNERIEKAIKSRTKRNTILIFISFAIAFTLAILLAN